MRWTLHFVKIVFKKTIHWLKAVLDLVLLMIFLRVLYIMSILSFLERSYIRLNYCFVQHKDKTKPPPPSYPPPYLFWIITYTMWIVLKILWLLSDQVWRSSLRLLKLFIFVCKSSCFFKNFTKPTAFQVRKTTLSSTFFIRYKILRVPL